jgi:hypothetical protein
VSYEVIVFGVALPSLVAAYAIATIMRIARGADTTDGRPNAV